MKEAIKNRVNGGDGKKLDVITSWFSSTREVSSPESVTNQVADDARRSNEKSRRNVLDVALAEARELKNVATASRSQNTAEAIQKLRAIMSHPSHQTNEASQEILSLAEKQDVLNGQIQRAAGAELLVRNCYNTSACEHVSGPEVPKETATSLATGFANQLKGSLQVRSDAKAALDASHAWQHRAATNFTELPSAEVAEALLESCKQAESTVERQVANTGSGTFTASGLRTAWEALAQAFDSLPSGYPPSKDP